jgi:hypothetical protein
MGADHIETAVRSGDSHLKNALKTFTVLGALIVLLGCARAKVYYPGSGASNNSISADPTDAQIYRDKIIQLEQQLIALSTTVDPAEAKLIAKTAVRESAVLAEKYQLVRPAVAHNLLVVLGIKNRGLCYHWTEDLMERLQALDLNSFQLHWGVAYRGSELREHNCVVVTARGHRFNSGIVLDPWRNSGDLFWAQVTKDGYPWEVLPRSDW